MESLWFKICFILITLAILIAAGFYSWSVVENIKLKELERSSFKIRPLSEWGK